MLVYDTRVLAAGSNFATAVYSAASGRFGVVGKALDWFQS